MSNFETAVIVSYFEDSVKTSLRVQKSENAAPGRKMPFVDGHYSNSVNAEDTMKEIWPVQQNRQKISWCVLITLMLLALSVSAQAQQFRGVSVVPDEEKRSSIHEVDGYAYLSETMTLEQVRNAAITTAKRQAVERAKTYIESNTTVENFEVTQDQIKGKSHGTVTVLEMKDLGVVDNTRYHVWIKAEVEYGIKPAGMADSGGQPDRLSATHLDPQAPLTVRVWTSKKEYKSGEHILVYMQGNRDFYARIVDITSSGDIIQLLPNEFRQQDRFEAGRTYQIPGEGDRFDLKVTPPFGEDRIVVYASEVPLGSVNMNSAGAGLGAFGGSQESLGIRTRGISVTATGKKSPSQSGAAFYESTWKLRTGP
ncbi:MAG: DUF4384 domain-containing protein [Desulfobacterales bacterium]|nr:DUF4384 domain-containing protein [Desulfobacterales bacterium]